MSAESCKMKRSIITTDQTTDLIVTAIALGTVVALAAFGFHGRVGVTSDLIGTCDTVVFAW